MAGHTGKIIVNLSQPSFMQLPQPWQLSWRDAMGNQMQSASSGIHVLQSQALRPLAVPAEEPGELPWPGTSRDTAHTHSLHMPDSQHQAIQLPAGQVLQSEQHIWQGHSKLGRMASQASQAGPWLYSQTSQPALMQTPTSGDRAWQEAMRSVAPTSAPIMPQHQPLQPLGPSVNLQQQSEPLQQRPLAAPASARHLSQQHNTSTTWPQQPSHKLAASSSFAAEMCNGGHRESADARNPAGVAPPAAGMVSEMPLERFLDLHAALERGTGRVQDFSPVEAAMFRVSDLKLASQTPPVDPHS